MNAIALRSLIAAAAAPTPKDRERVLLDSTTTTCVGCDRPLPVINGVLQTCPVCFCFLCGQQKDAFDHGMNRRAGDDPRSPCDPCQRKTDPLEWLWAEEMKGAVRHG